MRLHRFYVSQPLGEEVVIDNVSIVSQWTKVFRYQVGDFVILFNGDGSENHYSLKEISKKLCMLIRTKSEPSRLPTKKITLYLSLIKKDNFELAAQKATELGITSIVPVLSERSEKKNVSLDRLEKISIEASEQCGRGTIPTIFPVISLEEALGSLHPSTHPLYCNKGGKALSEHIVGNNDLALFIGPEGGWGGLDLDLFQRKSIVSCSLGENVLRAETAAIVACAFASINQ